MSATPDEIDYELRRLESLTTRLVEATGAKVPLMTDGIPVLPPNAHAVQQLLERTLAGVEATAARIVARVIG